MNEFGIEDLILPSLSRPVAGKFIFILKFFNKKNWN
jgi:hypothetical protein